MKITLHGAAGEVTGSAYLVETENFRFLVDFGIFQGGPNLAAKNVVPAGLDPARLNAVLLTHAHLDHTGRLPLLTRHGFTGPIHTHPASIELAGLILRDSAHLQASEADRHNRKNARAGRPLEEPLYSATDVENTLRLFRPIEYDTPLTVAPGITARWVDAGHMLGSASIELTVTEGGKQKTIVFSGDVGPHGLAILRDAVPLHRADLVFLESTYGDKDHKPIPDTLAEFHAIIQDAVRRKARVLVPTFAVGRGQQIIYHLDEMFCAKSVTPFPIYLDSPMAIEASKIYLRHTDLFDTEAVALEKGCVSAQTHRHVHPTPTAQDSMKLNSAPGPCVILAGSGMCTGGRILHHLKHGLWHPETHVMIVGYQGQGTLGRQLVDRAPVVRIFGEEISVKAQIHTLNGFSGHAGQTELLQWFGSLAPGKPQVALTHGEARGREPLAALIHQRHGIKPLLPMQGDVIKL